MSYQERLSLVNVVSSLAINAVYAVTMLPRQPQGDAYAPEVFRFWGNYFLILIVVSIVAKIIIHILFSIMNAIATRERESGITDERDHQIELKSNRIGFYVFALGFVLAMLALAMDMPPTTMFLLMLSAGLASDVVGDLTSFFFYRRGF